MTIKELLRKIGEKSAVRSIDMRSLPLVVYQPFPPAKIQVLTNKTNE